MPLISTLRRHVDNKLVPAFGPEYVAAISGDFGISDPKLVSPRHQAYTETPPYILHEWTTACGGLATPSPKLVLPRHQAYTETPLYIPHEWTTACGGFPNPRAIFKKQPRVVIFGAGFAGTSMALELAKCGITPTLIEALPHAGGRMSGVDGKGQVVYLPGSMRYSPSEGSLFELAYHYGFGMQEHFADPGVSPTLLAFSKQVVQYWDDPTRIPEGFEAVFHGWNTMLKEGFKINGTQFAAATEHAKLLQSPDANIRANAIPLWQNYITHLKDKLLQQIMIEIFIENPNPPGGREWTMEELEERWGKGGIGSGGFGVFFDLCALTILRFLPNEWETDQCSFVEKADGKWKAAAAQKLVEAILDDAIQRGADVRFETKLVDIRKTAIDGSTTYTATVENKEGRYDIECDVPILTMPPTVVVKLGLARKDLFPPEICEAMHNIFMVETTKIFVSIPREHFKDPKTARVILGDLFQTYIMDFNDPKYLAGLLDYAWHTKSLFYRSENDPNECFAIIKEEITKALAGSQYENWLECLDDAENHFVIHWQNYEYELGAFPFLKACQDKYCNKLFHWTGKGGIRLTGEGYTPYGGWSEGAWIKKDHDFAHIADEYGEVLHPEVSPINRMRPVFEYGGMEIDMN